jgi:hypothetical protein
MIKATFCSISILLMSTFFHFSCQYNHSIPLKSQTTYSMQEYFPLNDIQWITYWDDIQEDTVQWKKHNSENTTDLPFTSFENRSRMENIDGDDGWSNNENGLFLHRTQGRYHFSPPIQIAKAIVTNNSQIQKNHIRYDEETKALKVYHTISTFAGVENLETKAGLIHDCLKFELEFFPWDNPHARNHYTYWFAKDFGLVKKDKKFQTLELKQIAIAGKLIPRTIKRRSRRYFRRCRTPNALYAQR